MSSKTLSEKRTLSAKEPYDLWLFCGKRPATSSILRIFHLYLAVSHQPDVLSVEFLLKTDSGYPKDNSVTSWKTMADSENAFALIPLGKLF